MPAARDDTEFDVTIVGAGIHGAGIAQAAAAAGYRTCVIEKSRPAAGTSSRSSKLIHGGLRYLETGRFGLVREALCERERLLRLAPGLVRRLRFLIPVYRDTRRRAWQLRCGLALYALLAGGGAHARFATIPRRDWALLDGLERAGLETVLRYFDAQTDDAALTAAVLRSAGEALGARVIMPAELLGARRDATGYHIGYRDRSGDCALTSRVLVNAAGPWVRRVQERISPAPPPLAIDLVQGAHLRYDLLVSDSAFYVEAPADGRAVFVMPWKDGMMIGTTERPFEGDPDAVSASEHEIAYLQQTLRHYFPAYAGRMSGSFAGLRVLPRGEGGFFERTRETIFAPDDAREPRAWAVYGGKLTTYRATAERLVAVMRPALPQRSPRADTRELVLSAS